MNARMIRIVTARILLAGAYLSCIMQWLWVAMVGLPSLIKTGAVDFIVTTPAPVTQQPTEPIEASPIAWIFVIAVTIGVLMMTIIVLLKIPKAIMKTGEKIVYTATEAVVPVVTHHKHVPAKKKQAIKMRVSLLVQLSLAIVPLILSLFLQPYEEITRQIILIVATWLAILSIVGFLIARLIKPAATTSQTQSHAFRG